MGLIIFICCVLDELLKGYSCYSENVPFPEQLKNERELILPSLSFFPLIVDKVENKEFAREFREIFTGLFDEVPESDEE